MTELTLETVELNRKRDEFIDEEAHEASLSWEMWHISKEGGTAGSEIVRGDVGNVHSRILELAGRSLGEGKRGTLYHEDGYSGGFNTGSYADKDTGDVFCYYRAHRGHSWWEGVDQRLNEVGLPPDYLTDEMRGFVRREIVFHII